MFVAASCSRPVAVLVCATLAASGCANQKQYASFAEAGVATSDAITAILPVYAQTYLDASSERLLADRAEMPGARTLAFSPGECPRTQTEEFVRRTCDDLNEMRLLAELQAHMALMRRYFTALDAVATSSAPAQASADAGAIVKDLSATGAAMKGRLAAPTTVVSPVTTLVLNTAISGALRARLEADQQTIRTELALEKQVLTQLDHDLVRRQTDLFALKFQRTVVDPYADGTAVKTGDAWIARRRAMLIARLTGSGGAMQQAIAALDSLTKAFEALVQGGDVQAELAQAIADANAAGTIIKAVRGASS